MFSGIVEHLVKPISINKEGENMLLTLPIPKNWKLNKGESINIDGVCSTVQGLTKQNFTVYYMPETLRKTALSKIKKTHRLNLEKSLTLNTLIGGHLVSGHIDTIAHVSSITQDGNAKVVKFKINSKFTKYMIYKGSITVNGVSLTIVEAEKNYFTVSLIPFTLEHTNLGLLEVGQEVNIEVDMTAKYIEKLLNYRK